MLRAVSCFLWIECDFQTRFVVVEMGRPGGSGKSFGEALLDHVRRNACGLSLAGIAKC